MRHRSIVYLGSRLFPGACCVSNWRSGGKSSGTVPFSVLMHDVGSLGLLSAIRRWTFLCSVVVGTGRVREVHTGFCREGSSNLLFNPFLLGEVGRYDRCDGV